MPSADAKARLLVLPSDERTDGYATMVDVKKFGAAGRDALKYLKQAGPTPPTAPQRPPSA